MSPEVRVFPNLDELSTAAADCLVSGAREAVADRCRFTIAVAGGSTPRALYRLLAGEYGTRIPWGAVDVFFGDERCVPPNDPRSNFGMVNEALLARVPLPAERAHPIPVAELAPAEAAWEYDRLLRQLFKAQAAAPEEPRTAPPATLPGESFDLVLLGVGADGHTASLFPGSSALEEQHRWAVAVEAPPHIDPRCRVTLTLPIINQARTVYFLCAGAEKGGVVREILQNPHAAAARYPAARIRARKQLVWFVDRAVISGGRT